MENRRLPCSKEHRSVRMPAYHLLEMTANRGLVYGLLSLQQRDDIGVPEVDVWKPERWGRFSLGHLVGAALTRT
jgi:hypothetical protein